MAVKRLIWAHLWSLLGAVGLLFALTPFPPPAQATLPYLNSSICLATVAATAFVDGNGAKVILGWPTSMPSTLPAAASCLPIGAVFPITTSQSLSIQPAAIQDPVSAEIDSRPGGVYYCHFADWGHPCYYYAFQPSDFGVCWVLDEFNDQFSAIGPDYGTVVDLHKDSSCNDLAMGDVVYPGFADLSMIDLDNKIKSIFVKRQEQMGPVG